MTVACRQFRCRDIENCELRLYNPNDTTIESSKNLLLMPYNIKYPLLKYQAEMAKIVGDFVDEETGKTLRMVNKWKEVFDFTPPEEGTNYELADPKKFEVFTFDSIADRFGLDQELRASMAGNNDFIFELPVEYGGSLN